MDEEHRADPAGKAAEAAAAESSKQLVALAFTVITAPFVMRYMMRHMREAAAPDAERISRARGLRRMERGWNALGRGLVTVAGFCMERAEEARTAYEAERAQ